MPRKSQQVKAQEAVLTIRRLMKARDGGDDMKLAVVTLQKANGASGLADLAMKHPKLVISLAESWVEMEDTPAYSGDPDAGRAWS
jgi:hypothetical protein